MKKMNYMTMLFLISTLSGVISAQPTGDIGLNDLLEKIECQSDGVLVLLASGKKVKVFCEQDMVNNVSSSIIKNINELQSSVFGQKSSPTNDRPTYTPSSYYSC